VGLASVGKKFNSAKDSDFLKKSGFLVIYAKTIPNSIGLNHVLKLIRGKK